MFLEFKEINIGGKDLVELLESTLSKGACFRLKAKGFSMAPFIKDGDVLTLAPLSKTKISFGKIIAYKDIASKGLIIHRVIGINGGYYFLKGDNVVAPDGLIAKNRVLGVVNKIERDNRNVSLGLGWEKVLIVVLSRMNFFHLLPILRRLKRVGKI